MIPWMVPIYHKWKCFHTRVWKVEFPRKEIWVSKICYQTGVFVLPTQFFFYDSMDGSNLPQLEMFVDQGVEIRISKKGKLDF